MSPRRTGKAATVKEVAALAGVSTATVSYVISGTRPVSDELQQRVRDAMETLSFRPNLLARSLREGHSKVIGLMIPDNRLPYFAELAQYLGDAGFEKGYSVILSLGGRSAVKEAAFLETLVRKQVDGIVLMSAIGRSQEIEWLMHERIPVVATDRELEQYGLDLVLPDHAASAELAIRHLLELGHQRIACIAGNREVVATSDILDGVRRALSEAGVPYDKDLVGWADFHASGARDAMARFLTLPEPPTAVFVGSSLMTVGAMSLLSEEGKQVPRDISIISNDQIGWVDLGFPHLTSVGVSLRDMADTILELLLQRIENRSITQPRRIVLPVSLAVRGSCRRLDGDAG